MSRDYVIITDSTADMDAKYYEMNNVKVVGLHYTIGIKEYTQGSSEELAIDKFYERVRSGVMPKSAPVTYEDALDVMDKIAAEGKDIFFLCFSSALSTTYQTCQTAAQDVCAKYSDCTIKVVDSICASLGEGLLLHLCIKKKNSGATLEDLEKYAERMKGHVVHSFTVDNLNHLQRGGRISKLSAMFGTLLSVKPLLFVDAHGALGSYAKIKGKKKALETMAEHMKEKYMPGENEEIFIFDADCAEESEYLGKLVMQMMPDVKRIRYGKIGAVIGAHTGADAIAMAYIGKSRTPVEQ